MKMIDFLKRHTNSFINIFFSLLIGGIIILAIYVKLYRSTYEEKELCTYLKAEEKMNVFWDDSKDCDICHRCLIRLSNGDTMSLEKYLEIRKSLGYTDKAGK